MHGNALATPEDGRTACKATEFLRGRGRVEGRGSLRQVDVAADWLGER